MLLPLGVVTALLTSGGIVAGLQASGTLRSFLDGTQLAELQRRAQLGLTVPTSSLLALLVPVLVTVTLAVALGPLLNAVTTPLAAHLTQHPAGARAALTRLRGRIPVLLGCAAITAVGVVAGSVALVVPGLIVALMLQPVGSVAVMEGLGVKDTLRRTARLTAGHRPRIAGIVVLVSLISGATGLVITRLLTGIVSVDDPVARYLIEQLITSIPAGMLLSWNAMTSALIYIDLRIRKEDLGRRLAVAPGRSPAGGSIQQPG